MVKFEEEPIECDTVEVKNESQIEIGETALLFPFYKYYSNCKMKEENVESKEYETEILDDEFSCGGIGKNNFKYLDKDKQEVQETLQSDNYHEEELSNTFNVDQIHQNVTEFSEELDMDVKIDISEPMLQSSEHNEFAFEKINNSVKQETLPPTTQSEPLKNDHPLIQQKKDEIKSNLKSLQLSKIHACKMCSYYTTEETFLNKHIASIHNNLRIIIKSTITNCQICDKLFPSKLLFDNHMRIKHREKIQSDMRNFQTSTKRVFDDHLIKRHNKEINGDLKDYATNNIHSCKTCSYKTTKKTCFNEHVYLVHKKVLIKSNFCEFCNKSFIQKCSLYDHLLKQHKNEIKSNEGHFIKVKIYTCKVCFYKTTSKHSFSTHVRTHKKERQTLRCQFCNKSFLRQCYLEDHQLKYHRKKVKSDKNNFITSKVYKCNVCPYKTTRKRPLSLHKKLYHNERRPRINCNFCDKSFLTKVASENHLLRKHKHEIKGDLKDFISSKIHTCKICFYKTTFKCSLNSHIILIHKKKRLAFKCQFCNKSLVTKNSLEDHLLKQHKQKVESDIKSFVTGKIHKCDSCSFKTTKTVSLNFHINLCHNKQRTKVHCTFCDKSFLSKTAHDDHLLKKHKMEINVNLDLITTKIHACKMCSYKTVNHTYFNRHIHSVHKKCVLKSHFCQFCNKSFGQKLSLHDHLLKQHKNKLKNDEKRLISNMINTCHMCSYKSIFKSSLKRHIRSIHQFKERLKLKCQFCDKTLMSKWSLDDHQLKQHKNKVESDKERFITSKIHKCEICSYETTRKEAFNSHMNSIHNHKRIKFNCDFCEKSFVKKVSLQDHLIKNHKEKINNDLKKFITSNIHSCNICSYKTMHKECLNMHINLKHKGQRTEMKCAFCDKTFTTKPALDDHLLKQHKDDIKHNKKDFVTSKIHSCDFCSYETTSKAHFRTHIRARHKKQG